MASATFVEAMSVCGNRVSVLPAEIRHPEQPHSAKPRVLLIGDDPSDGETFTAALSSLPLDNAWSRSGLQGLAVARHERFDLLLVDRDLPDMSATDVIRSLRADDDRACCILVTRSVCGAVAIDALRLGAVGLIEKPLKVDDVIAVIDAALRLRHDHTPAAPATRNATTPSYASVPVGLRSPRSATGSIAERWARLILSTVHAERDPKTIGTWSKAIGVSRTVLCECCRLVHVSPHEARDFARVMRAIWRCGTRWQPERVLDLADARSLKRLFHRAGLTNGSRTTPTIEEFLDRQQWIVGNNPGLDALRALLCGEPGYRDSSIVEADGRVNT